MHPAVLLLDVLCWHCLMAYHINERTTLASKTVGMQEGEGVCLALALISCACTCSLHCVFWRFDMVPHSHPPAWIHSTNWCVHAPAMAVSNCYCPPLILELHILFVCVSAHTGGVDVASWFCSPADIVLGQSVRVVHVARPCVK
jgi:hypothetical protein